MRFSKETREAALISAARHCCICHRYSGLKIEVHHIVPISDGGTNDIDNAIALCFDCHTDAGHYNPKHPRGTKFSREEMLKARDAWYDIVRTGSIPVKQQSDFLHCRYYACRDFNLLSNIVCYDIRQTPFTNGLIIENSVLAFQRWVLSKYGKHPSRLDFIHGQSFSDLTCFREKYPESQISIDPIYGEECASSLRMDLQDDDVRTIFRNDPLTAILGIAGVPISNLSYVRGYWQRCGSDSFNEEYVIRELWAIFLAITNMSNRTITLQTLESYVFDTEGIAFQRFNSASYNEECICTTLLPETPIRPNELIVLPIATLLAPLKHDNGFSWDSTIISEEVYSRQHEIQRAVKHEICEDGMSGVFHQLGPSIRPLSLKGKSGDERFVDSIHNFEPTNVYTIDTDFMCGSCPHVFLRRANGTIVHYKTILVNAIRKTDTEEFIIEGDTVSIIVAELEAETTVIENLSIDGVTIKANFRLHQGDHFQIEVTCGQRITIQGSYEPQFTTHDVYVKSKYSRQAVNRFIKSVNPS